MKRKEAGSDRADAPVRKRSKDAPQELSAKKPPPRMHVSVPNAKGKAAARDPRFDPMCGDFREDIFKSSYRFLEDVKKEELGLLIKKERKTKATEAKAAISEEVKKRKQELAAEKQHEHKREMQSALKKAQRELVAQGKQPFYLKKREEKVLDHVEKFLQLKKSGKLNKYLEKRRRKLSAKDRKWLPSSSPSSSARPSE